MATAVQKTIDIIFAGTDNVSSTIATIGNNIDSIGSNMEDIGAPFEAATEKIALMQLAVLGITTAMITASSNIESETTKMVNSLGLPAKEAEKFKEIAIEAYNTGVVDDMSLAFEAVTLAQQKLGDGADTDIGKVTENALKLSKTFGIDINESMNAVSVLMQNFGLDSQTAFDFVTKGYQDGLDGSGDFIQSVTEYSTQFASGGANAEQFFSILSTGYQDGFLGADKAADAFKEFRVRIQDGSALTAESLALIGIDNTALQANLQAGTITVNDAFNQIIGKLGETTDKQVLMQAGTGLLGTQFEDLGTKGVLALDSTKVKLEEIQGTIDSMTFEDFETSLTSSFRTAFTAVLDLPIWENLKSKIAENAEDISESFVTVLKDYDFSDVITKFEKVWDQIGGVFDDAGVDLTSVDGMKEAIDLAVDSLGSLLDVTKGQIEIFEPLFSIFVDLVKQFNDLDTGTKELVGNLLSLGAGIAAVGSAISIGGVFLGGISTVIALLSGPIGLGVALAAAAVGLSNLFSDFEPMPDSYFTTPKQLLDEFKESIELFPKEIKTKLSAAVDEGASTQEVMALIDQGQEAVDIQWGIKIEEEGLDEIEERLYSIPDEKPVMVQVDGEWVAIDELESKIQALEDKKIPFEVEVDKASVDKAKEQISILVGEGDNQRIVTIDVEPAGIAIAKAKIDEIPTEKQLEIQLQGNIDTEIALIKTTAETAQSAFKYKAEIDISEIESQTEIIKSAYDSINNSINSTAQLMGQALGTIDTADSFQAKWAALDVLREESELREKSFNLQEKLTNAEIEHLKAKTEALENGESNITIDSSGLEPALEMIMWEIIQKVQVRATAEASEFLLGL